MSPRPFWTGIPPLSWGETFSFPFHLGLVVVDVLGAAIKRGLRFRPILPGLSVKDEITRQGVRSLLARLTTLQFRVAQGTHEAALKKAFAEAPSLKDIYERVVTKGFALTLLKDQNVAIGDARVVLMWVHGGACTSGDSALQMVTFGRLRSNLMKVLVSSEVAIVLLDYDLAPEVAHPVPTLEVAAAYDYLTTTLAVTPSRLFVGGDSAGGNLLLSFLLHQVAAKPMDLSSSPSTAAQIRELGLESYLTPPPTWTPPPVCVVMSPWISPACLFPGGRPTQSYTSNAEYDVIEYSWLVASAKAYFRNGTFDLPSADCLKVDTATWAKALAGMVVVCEYGKREIFCDEIEAFLASLKEADIKTDVMAWAEGFHEPTLLNVMLKVANHWEAVDALSEKLMLHIP